MYVCVGIAAEDSSLIKASGAWRESLNLYTCIHTHIHIYTFMCMYAHINVYAYIYTCVGIAAEDSSLIKASGAWSESVTDSPAKRAVSDSTMASADVAALIAGVCVCVCVCFCVCMCVYVCVCSTFAVIHGVAS